MSDQLEQAEVDELWLYNKMRKLMRKPSNEEVDTFCDRVWVLISEQGIDTVKARSIALAEIVGG